MTTIAQISNGKKWHVVKFFTQANIGVWHKEKFCTEKFFSKEDFFQLDYTPVDATDINLWGTLLCAANELDEWKLTAIDTNAQDSQITCKKCLKRMEK